MFLLRVAGLRPHNATSLWHEIRDQDCTARPSPVLRASPLLRVRMAGLNSAAVTTQRHRGVRGGSTYGEHIVEPLSDLDPLSRWQVDSVLAFCPGRELFEGDLELCGIFCFLHFSGTEVSGFSSSCPWRSWPFCCMRPHMSVERDGDCFPWLRAGPSIIPSSLTSSEAPT